MSKIKTAPKLVIGLALIVGGLLELKHLVYVGVIPRPSALKTAIPIKAEEVSATVLTGSTVAAKPLPSATPMSVCMDGNTSNCLNSTTQEIEIWAWNGNAALLYATGSAQTTRGSLAAAHNVAITIRRQDDTGQMMNDLLDTAQKLQTDPNASGTNIISIIFKSPIYN